MKRTAKVCIEGTKLLLFNAFKEECLDKKKSKGGSAGMNPDEWKTSVNMDAERNLYFPDNYFFGCIKSAGAYSKMGRGNIIKYVAATLEIGPEKVFLDGLKCPKEDEISRDANLPVHLDVRSVVNPMTKGRNLRYRVACKAGWACTFFVSWDDSVLSISQMQTLLKDAGLMCGIGCGRAIGLGRFKVNAFEVQ